MRIKSSFFFGLAIAAIAVVGGARAIAQAQRAGDFSTFKGTNQRTGNNGDAANTGPGQSKLNWYRPIGTSTTPRSVRKPVIDNTDTQTPGSQDGVTFDSNKYGYTTNLSGTWSAPSDPNSEAGSPFLKSVSVTPPNTDYNSRTPAYVYAQCTPASTINDPTHGAGVTSDWSWTFTGDPAAKAAQNYAVYVNIPSGPTKINGKSVFPSRYFVYEISYGSNGGHYTDVVDTYASGSGWVRLGGGGYNTNAVFPFDGTNPITVALHNTIPLGSDGKPLSSPHPAQNYIVYADAVRFEPTNGLYNSSPTAFRLLDSDYTSTVVTAANNELSAVQSGNTTLFDELGVVTNYTYGGHGNTVAAASRWTYSLIESSTLPIVVDSTSANITVPYVDDPTAAHVSPGDAYVAPVSTDPTTGVGTVTYSPSLTASTYNIFVYVPGKDLTHDYAQNVTYTVTEAGGITETFTIDQSMALGWVRLGGKRFPNSVDNTGNSTLGVFTTNYSSVAADGGKVAYAGAVRFVTDGTKTISSSPVHAQVAIQKNDGTSALTKVVVVADDNGYIHCLDATGNPDGTTTEYWTYPSIRDSVGYDPNLGKPGAKGPDYGGPDATAAADRQPTAVMPQGFGLSSPLIQRVGGKDYLYIGSSNGRVYCIDMAGRGDYASTDPISGGTHISGTTTRAWTYPNTYPAPNPISANSLGKIQGSVAYDQIGGVDTIFVPTTSGRLFALNAAGNGDGSTSLAWAFPALGSVNRVPIAPVGPIVTTPTVAFGKVYFGTLGHSTSKGPVTGQFFALDETTGTQSWVFPTGKNTVSDFLGSPAVADDKDLDPTLAAPTGHGLVYTINQNNYVYALDSATGVPVWQTNELNAGSEASLTFTWQTVLTGVGQNTAPAPVVVVATQDGRFASLGARLDDVNRFGSSGTHSTGSRRLWQYSLQGNETVASLASQGLQSGSPIPTGWLYGGDAAGFLYAFNQNVGNGGSSDPNAPGGEDVVENDIRGDIYRKAKLKLISRDTYSKLRLPVAASIDYATATTSTGPTSVDGKFGFEWGQTAYILVYDFPFETTNTKGDPIDPPVVNFSFTVDGKVVRGVAVQARQFSLKGSKNPKTYDEASPITALGPPDGTIPMDGYAILAFPLQSSGSNSLPPGIGQIDLSISTASLNPNGIQQNVVLDPNTAHQQFYIANPIALVMPPTNAQVPSLTLPAANSAYSIGLSTNPLDPENIGNGTYSTTARPLASQLGTTVGTVPHGSVGKTIVYVVDRSMMSLLRPDGIGLDGIRLQLSDLGWQGGSSAVLKPLVTPYYNYANYEDLPVNSPNNSVDYPDLAKTNVSVTSQKTSTPENPLFNSVSLIAPLDSTTKAALTEDTLPQNRIFQPTPFELDVEVPKFQPPNNTPAASRVADSSGKSNDQGYLGQVTVFVDSVPNGKLDTTVHEAYRSFNLSTKVDVDERLSVTTPTVDLGSVPGGSGYSQNFAPGAGFVRNVTPAANVFQPYGTGNYQGLFQKFGVQNEGNVNLTDLRIAKVANLGNGIQTLHVGSSSADMNTYLDATFDVWSSIDDQFAPGPDGLHRTFIQKARVQDRVPTQLSINPIRRANPNLGTTGTVSLGGATYPDVLNQTVLGGALLYDPTQPPKIGVSVPIGFPVGTYSQEVKVYENDNHNSAPGTNQPLWDFSNIFGNASKLSTEPYTDRGMQLIFNVSETRLTGTFLPKTETMIDNITNGGANGQYANANLQPTGTRDIYGSLILAWSSNRPTYLTSVREADTGAYRIFLASLDNQSTFSTSQTGTLVAPLASATSPLRDLTFWRPAAAANWFARGIQNYPATPIPTLFGAGAFTGVARFGNPAFPALGTTDPFVVGNNFTSQYMAFTGEVNRVNADRTLQKESRLMIATVSSNGTGAITASVPKVQYGDDPLSIKGRPSVVQEGGTGTSAALVFYPVTAAGRSTILYTTFDGSVFGKAQALPFTDSFASLDNPSAVGRLFAGKTPVVELSFQGKLRGRPYPEVYLGRLALSNSGTVVTDAFGNVSPDAFVDQTPITDEPVTADGQASLYRSKGVNWDEASALGLVVSANGLRTNILVSNTQVYDSQTGIISYDCRLGGKVVFDPKLGTIRFTSSVPSSSAQLLLTYTPRFIRVSAATGSGSYGPKALYDSRLISDYNPWIAANGTLADFSSQSSNGTLLTNDRLILTYDRAGASVAGTSQSARPFITTMRFGVHLPYRLPTYNGRPGLSNGVAPVVIKFTDGGPNDAVEIDPTQGTGSAIYFPVSSEGRTVTIQQYALDDAGNLIVDSGGNPILTPTNPTPQVIGLTSERDEYAVPMDKSVNESGLTPFLDPFSYDNVNPVVGGIKTRRPPLMFFLWSSTRFGSPDLFLEGYAPRWTPGQAGP